MTNGDDFVRITNREVYERLGTVEAKLDNALGQLALQSATIQENGKRIRALELKFYGVLAGLLASLGAVVLAAGRGL